MLVSGEQQSDPVIQVYVRVLFQILFYDRLSRTLRIVPGAVLTVLRWIRLSLFICFVEPSITS